MYGFSVGAGSVVAGVLLGAAAIGWAIGLMAPGVESKILDARSGSTFAPDSGAVYVVHPDPQTTCYVAVYPSGTGIYCR